MLKAVVTFAGIYVVFVLLACIAERIFSRSRRVQRHLSDLPLWGDDDE